jgi:hypothetical protein
MRRYLFLAAICLLAGASRVAGQQVYLFAEKYYGFGADTALVVPSGQTEYLILYGGVSGGVSGYSISIYVDTTRLRIVQADSFPGYNLPSPTITRDAADRITLSVSGATGYSGGAYLARIGVQAMPGATVGSLFSVRVNSWTTQAGASVDRQTIDTDLMDGCIAQVLWGDPDSSLTVTGRDALIALTNAVGLPVTGFDLSVADVDDDGVETSRDALLMLAYAVGLSNGEYYYTYKAGIPKAGRCAPLTGVPSAMAFLRGTAAGNLYTVPTGDSVAVAVGSPTAFYNSQPVRWSPDGTKILATAYTSAYYYEPIAVTTATLVEDTLARNSSYDGGGAYSLDGLRIAFHSTRTSYYLYLMDANGANQVEAQQVNYVTSYSTSNPAWSPDGQRVAFTGYPAAGGTNGLWTLRVDSGTVRAEFPASTSYPPVNPRWSPAGDSLLFQANSRLYAVAAPDTATVPRRIVMLSATMDNASWTSAGILFRRLYTSSSPSTYDYYVRRPDGRILRVFRAAGTQDMGASFR